MPHETPCGFGLIAGVILDGRAAGYEIVWRATTSHDW
jgi:hypothetical protein